MCCVRNQQFWNNSWVLLHENVHAHYTLKMKQFLAAKSICVIQQPPTCQIWQQQTFSLPKGKTGPKREALQWHYRHWTWCHQATERGFISGLPARIQEPVSTISKLRGVGGRLYWKSVVKASKYIHSLFRSTCNLIIYQAHCVLYKNMWNKLSVNVDDMEHPLNSVTCSSKARKSFEWYDSTNWSGYICVNQEVLCSPFLLHTFLHNKYLMHSVVNYSL
jgi:hypothetical protein